MSLTNHIIIPIVGSKQNLQDQNIFITPFFTATPSKQDEIPDFTFWKKASSAFKKFKQKKEKKEKRSSQQNQNMEPLFDKAQKAPFKLRLREKAQEGSGKESINIQQMVLRYYDPNEAPLYEMRFPNEYQYRQKVSDSRLKSEKAAAEVPCVKYQRVESEVMDQQVGYKVVIEPRFDDPFIIIRKDCKKTSKPPKSKPIRKERSRGRDADEQEKRLAFNPPKGDGQQPPKRDELFSPHLLKSKTSQSALRGENDSDSLESDSENEEEEHPPMKKEMFTIQHFMDLSRQKVAGQTVEGGQEDHGEEGFKWLQ